MALTDRLVAWNARQAQRWSVLTVVLKGVIGFMLAGIIMAILVPALHTRGVTLRSWMIWTVMGLSIAVCIGPDVYYRYRRRALEP
jgi:hypothetical protein